MTAPAHPPPFPSPYTSPYRTKNGARDNSVAPTKNSFKSCGPAAGISPRAPACG